MLHDVTAVNQKDWLATIKQLGLSIELNGSHQWRLGVEKGKEKQWARALIGSGLVDTIYVDTSINEKTRPHGQQG